MRLKGKYKKHMNCGNILLSGLSDTQPIKILEHSCVLQLLAFHKAHQVFSSKWALWNTTQPFDFDNYSVQSDWDNYWGPKEALSVGPYSYSYKLFFTSTNVSSGTWYCATEKPWDVERNTFDADSFTKQTWHNRFVGSNLEFER